MAIFNGSFPFLQESETNLKLHIEPYADHEVDFSFEELFHHKFEFFFRVLSFNSLPFPQDSSAAFENIRREFNLFGELTCKEHSSTPIDEAVETMVGGNLCMCMENEEGELEEEVLFLASLQSVDNLLDEVGDFVGEVGIEVIVLCEWE